METEAEPSIIGPVAPTGTSAPWDIHKDTIVVRKMAGKTDTIPDMNGRPRPAIQTEAAIAEPAARPREKRVNMPTLLIPEGAGRFVFTAKTPIITAKAVANRPIVLGPMSSDIVSTTNVDIPAKRDQMRVETMETENTRFAPFIFVPMIPGRILHEPRKATLRSMPIGTIDIAWVKGSIPLTPPHIPMLAGTIVVGRVIIPPKAPPPLSITTVARIATNPANNAGRRIADNSREDMRPHPKKESMSSSSRVAGEAGVCSTTTSSSISISS